MVYVTTKKINFHNGLKYFINDKFVSIKNIDDITKEHIIINPDNNVKNILTIEDNNRYYLFEVEYYLNK